MIAASVLKEGRGRVVVFHSFLARMLNTHRMSLNILAADAMNVLDKCLR